METFGEQSRFYVRITAYCINLRPNFLAPFPVLFGLLGIRYPSGSSSTSNLHTRHKGSLFPTLSVPAVVNSSTHAQTLHHTPISSFYETSPLNTTPLSQALPAAVSWNLLNWFLMGRLLWRERHKICYYYSLIDKTTCALCNYCNLNLICFLSMHQP